MVAIASPSTGIEAAVARRRDVWPWATIAVLAFGVVARLVLGGGGVGARSALVMTLLLAVGGWLVCWLLKASSRSTLFAVAAIVAALDLAALPVPSATGFDEREALFRSDQDVQRMAAVPPNARPMLMVVAEAVYPTGQAQPRFELNGTVNQKPLVWRCQFGRGVQRFGLQVPPETVAGQANLDVRLRLGGSPSRETDYLLVYSSSQKGGYLISLATADSPSNNDVPTCPLA